MQAQTIAENLAILPVRVGDGDVPGVPFNTIVPDIRGRTPEMAADLIISRLRLFLPASPGSLPQTDWPDQPLVVVWPLANHTDVRGAFESLLTRSAPWRFLPVRGPSNSGKSHISRQILSNALRVPELACGRFDFKGTTDMDNEIASLVQNLEVPKPANGGRLNARLGQILDSLKQSARPALLIFDTYEAAGEGQEWIEKQLLPSLIRSNWLRVVITGQTVPRVQGQIWENNSSPIIELKVPPAPDWWEFGKQYDPELTLEEVETACRLAGNNSGLLAQLLGPKEIL